MAANNVCHIEWEVTDFARSRVFFEGLFGWNFQEFGDEMVVFGLGEQHIGGLIKVDSVGIGRSPSIWIEVDSIEAACTKAKAVGGQVSKGKSEVPHVGWSATLTDPDGNFVGIVQFAEKN